MLRSVPCHGLFALGLVACGAQAASAPVEMVPAATVTPTAQAHAAATPAATTPPPPGWTPAPRIGSAASSSPGEPASSATSTAPRSSPVQVASAVAEALRAGEFARATKPFDATMAAGLSPDQLRATWLGVQAQAGALTSFGAPTTDVVAGGFVRVHLPARFEQATLDLQVVVDPSTGLVKGLWVRPPGGP